MKPYIIGIAGGSGSGKTSLVNELKKSFSPEEICFISQDDYYHPRELQKKDKEGIENFDRPESINHQEMNRDIKKIIAGEVIERIEYLYNNKNATPRKLVFAPAPILIVEGIFVFHYKKIRKKLDMKIFVDAKENLKVIRRISRDRVERGYPLDDVLYRYQKHILPAFEKYILPYRDRSDIVINNNKDFKNGLSMLNGFLKNKLEEFKIHSD